MKHKIAYTILGITLGLIFLNHVHNLNDVKQNIPLIRCQDYNYQIEFDESELPVEINFYIIEDGKEKFFKKEIANEKFESTLLHCGHDYKAVYEFENYKPFVDYISIPEVNPVIQKVTKISVK